MLPLTHARPPTTLYVTVSSSGSVELALTVTRKLMSTAAVAGTECASYALSRLLKYLCFASENRSNWEQTKNIKISFGALYLLHNATNIYYSNAIDPGHGRTNRLSRECTFSLS